jgi:hypothetical protein
MHDVASKLSLVLLFEVVGGAPRCISMLTYTLDPGSPSSHLTPPIPSSSWMKLETPSHPHESPRTSACLLSPHLLGTRVGPTGVNFSRSDDVSCAGRDAYSDFQSNANYRSDLSTQRHILSHVMLTSLSGNHGSASANICCTRKGCLVASQSIDEQTATISATVTVSLYSSPTMPSLGLS